MAVSESQVVRAVGEIVKEIVGMPAESVTPDKSFVEDLDLDSLALVELGFALEDRFSVEIAEADIKDLVTVSDVVDYVISRARVPS